MADINKLKNKLVVQANQLIEASYKLKPSQQKFLRVMASMINKNDEDFKMYEFKINELLELFELKDQSKYKEIPKQTRELMGNILTFKTDKKIIQVPFLNYCEYEIGTGTLRVQFHPFLKPFYLYLNKENPFTKYELINILPLRSVYSIRLYELLKQYEKLGNRTIEVDKLKELFQINPNQYTRYNDFKRKVIMQAQKELPLKTDISFDFEEIKTGRKVTSIRFYIHSKTKNISNSESEVEKEISATIEEAPKELEETPQEQPKERVKEPPKEKEQLEDPAYINELNINQVKNIFQEKIKEREAKKILAAANGNLELIKEKYTLATNTQSIKNIVGWVIDAMKNNYQANNKTKIDNFNNYEQRDYSKEQLGDIEKKLLGWDKE